MERKRFNGDRLAVRVQTTDDLAGRPFAVFVDMANAYGRVVARTTFDATTAAALAEAITDAVAEIEAAHAARGNA
jgi:predicted outer membrane protein